LTVEAYTDYAYNVIIKSMTLLVSVYAWVYWLDLPAENRLHRVSFILLSNSLPGTIRGSSSLRDF